MLYEQSRRIDPVSMRDAYCDALLALAEDDPTILAIEADVMHSMGTVRFAERFPDRSINCGIQEANAVGVAAGLALQGFKPFFHAFGTFATRRTFDQVFLSCAYGGAHIRIVGGDAGVTAGANGGTHMPFEDMALMRAIPGMLVIEPADTVCIRGILPAIAAYDGSAYMRCSRQNMMRVYHDGAPFSIGGANLLRDGADVSILACGLLLHESLLAAEMLAACGISAQVADCYSIKPLDEQTVLRCAEKTGAVVTAENHNRIGGLGSAVADLLAREAPTPMEMIGVNERFGEVGTVEYLQQRFGLTAQTIVRAAKTVIKRKGGVMRHDGDD